MAKHSNPDPQASNFSVLNTSLSQDLGTADSLSIPSEPTEIGNWFSSYVYESPELDTCHDFEGHGLSGSGCVGERVEGEEKSKEKEEDLGGFRKIRKKEELVLGEKVASIGILESNNSCEDQNHGNKNASEVLGDSSDTLSLSSEPPDITRWFASYVYESPILDTSDDFRGSGFTESECERVGCNVENCKGRGENLTEFRRTIKSHVLAANEKILSNGLVKCKSYDTDNYDHQYNCEDIHAVEGNEMSSVPNELHVKTISGQVLEEEPKRHYDVGSTQDGEKSSFNGRVSIGKKRNNEESQILSLNPNEITGRNNIKSREKLTHGRDFVSVEVRKPTRGSNGKENDGKTFPENGFVSMRNDRSMRPSDGSYLKRSVEVGHFVGLRIKVTDSSEVENEGILRKPFLETTNFRHNEVLEITGKWKCPQKSKPNLGPPLKQLRLEQWVHRV